MKAPGLLLFLAAGLPASDATFLLETRSLEPYTRTYIGNGEMGLSSSRLGTSAADCFVSGVYDHGSGDVPRIARLPAWNEIDVSDGQQWLNQAGENGRGLDAYKQTLDMFDGVLRTEYQWHSGSRMFTIQVESFLSRADPRIGGVQLQLTPQSDGLVRVRLPVREWPEPRRYPLERLEKLEGAAARDQQAIWYPGHMNVTAFAVKTHEGGALEQVVAKADGSRQALAEAIEVSWPRGLDSPHVERSHAQQNPGIEIAFQAHAGRSYTFSKIAVVVPDSAPDYRALAASKAHDALAHGYPALLAAHVQAWHELWQSDIIVDGDSALQTAIHSMLFYLLASVREDSNFSVPPMGLSTAGYYGHVFWDADTYMFPPLLLLHPELARPIVMFRSRTLEAARVNAKRNGYQGAMYPWEAGPDGAETTPRFAHQNALYENHVNGDVALAAWQYYLSTGDRTWLMQYGYPILRDTADFWLSRVTYNRERDRYEIGKVVSVVESDIGVDNDPYTNAAAKKNLELASTAAGALGLRPNPKWSEVSSKLYVPASESVLIDYPLELPISMDQKRAMARVALAKPPQGAMMGNEFEPILGVELGDRALIDQLLPRTWRPYVRPPFNVLAETPANQNINFITGAGAFLHQFVFGYSGMRLSEGGLQKRYRPLLPGSVRKIVFKGISVGGARRTLTVTDGSVE